MLLCWQKSFGIPRIEILNMFMQYAYVATLGATFLLSMGNRPVGAKYKYMTGAFLLSRLGWARRQ